MKLHPDLRALRDDDIPQRVAQNNMLSALNDWRRSKQPASVAAAIESYAAGAELDACPALLALFDPRSDAAALRYTAGFVTSQLRAQRATPLGHLAIRHFTDGTLSTLLLAQCGKVTLTLVAQEGRIHRQRPVQSRATFTAIEASERILAGSAVAEMFERRRGGSQTDAYKPVPVTLKPGMVCRRNGAERALIIRAVSGCLVTLRLQRRDSQGAATAEIDLDTGAELQSAAADPQDSRAELMLELLGRMGRSDAVPIMSAIAAGTAGVSLRWQALRECLSLDTATGFAALSGVADNPDDPLCQAASVLRNQLVRAHPILNAKEVEPCPA